MRDFFPDTWKLANVIPIFKKGDKSQPCNYRTVALLSCIGKLQERIVFINMYNFLIENNLLWVLTAPLNSFSVNRHFP